MEPRSGGRRVTRSRATTAGDGGTSIDTVTKFLQELTKPDATKESTEPPMYETIKSAVEKRARALGRTTTAGPNRIMISDEFLSTVEDVVDTYLHRVIEGLVTVSRHRAGCLASDESADFDSMAETSTSLEEWLLHKEDCATYMTRLITGEKREGPIPPPPVFTKADYAAHAAEEETTMLLTAQSVRRLTLRDLLPLLLCESKVAACPPVLRTRLVNRIAALELHSEYSARGAHPPTF